MSIFQGKKGFLTKVVPILLSLVFLTSGGPLEEYWMKDFSHVPSLYGNSDTVCVRITGDVMMHSEQMKYDYNHFLDHIESFLSNADIAVANMEFSLGGKPYSGYPCFSAPDEFAGYVAGCGVDVFLTANNHILDRGSKGFARTLGIYSEMEQSGIVRYTGSGSSPEIFRKHNPLIIRKKGIKIAFLNFTYDTNVHSTSDWPATVIMDDRDEIAAEIKYAKENGADIIIALPHWGEEYKLRHDKAQEEMAVWLAENGVDAIVGSHPHVVQDMAYIEADGRIVPVYYSTGNAISNMSAKDTQAELMVSLKIVRLPDGKVFLDSDSHEWMWCSRPGGLCGNYAVIPVAEFIKKQEIWENLNDYNNMLSSLERVSSITGIR